jgi:hypothetical protein
MLLRSAGVTVVELLPLPNMNGLNVLEVVISDMIFPVNGSTWFMARVKLLHPDATVRVDL